MDECRQTDTRRSIRSVSRNFRIPEGMKHPDLEVEEKTKKKDNEEQEEEEKRTKRGEGGGEMGVLGSIHKVPDRELRYIQFHYHMKVLKPVIGPLCLP
jgi:hypothetical protein